MSFTPTAVGVIVQQNVSVLNVFFVDVFPLEVEVPFEPSFITIYYILLFTRGWYLFIHKEKQLPIWKLFCLVVLVLAEQVGSPT